ncbi:thioesterase family protein [Sphingobium sp. HBC34]|uniref:Thioesterase family protein n=1 Tax=Sphingobium cyanobacteriorum TaxID=3063954 RepID=A0ABT8ZI36_9SPHN|nr:acyl-CoA thioesterase domain-containing protein [Sphingobium sp. HBC34]MDO7833440.1 thioesterase family protein [Sphingobium sp. HBC34]
MNAEPCRHAASDILGTDATRIMELEQSGPDIFRTCFVEQRAGDHLFGGQIVAQALAAANRTVEGRVCHSMHAYFLRAGVASRPVTLTVERIRDGARFSTRRIVATQNDRAIFDMECSFHAGGAGPQHQVAQLPDVPPPEALPNLVSLETLGEGMAGEVAIARRFPLLELRLVDHERFEQPDPSGRRQIWIRMPTAANSDDPAVHQQLLAYLSDFMFSGVVKLPHPIAFRLPRFAATSLDHAIWFHRAHRCEEWLLYDCDSHHAADGRAMARGLLLDRAGRLVATVMQEALFRALQDR